MTGALEALAKAVTPTQALKIASSLEIDGSFSKAAAKVPHSEEPLLKLAFTELGAANLSDALRGFAAAAAANVVDLRPVWSGPTFSGDGDHTTAALAHLIDEATEDVFASTYSASSTSLYVQALWRCVARGVKTTVLLEPKLNEGKTSALIQNRLLGARFLGFKAGPSGGIQHSKVVIVDSRIAFITSANLSEAAHERNLEVGVIIRDPAFASTLRQRFSALYTQGHLYPITPPASADY